MLPAIGKAPSFQVDGRRLNPFDKGRIRSREQPKRLSDVPSVEIDFIDDRVLDDIVLVLKVYRQVPVRRARIDEARIIVAVWRREPPRTTTGLDRQQDAHSASGIAAREP